MEFERCTVFLNKSFLKSYKILSDSILFMLEYTKIENTILPPTPPPLPSEYGRNRGEV